jgi:hypothetical protein
VMVARSPMSFLLLSVVRVTLRLIQTFDNVAEKKIPQPRGSRPDDNPVILVGNQTERTAVVPHDMNRPHRIDEPDSPECP